MRITIFVDYDSVDPNGPDADLIMESYFGPAAIKSLRDFLAADSVTVEECDADD